MYIYIYIYIDVGQHLIPGVEPSGILRTTQGNYNVYATVFDTTLPHHLPPYIPYVAVLCNAVQYCAMLRNAITYSGRRKSATNTVECMVFGHLSENA